MSEIPYEGDPRHDEDQTVLVPPSEPPDEPPDEPLDEPLDEPPDEVPEPVPAPSRPAAEPHRGSLVGYADPGLLAGRGAGIWVYMVALLFAAAADVGNFYQIIQFALPTQQNRLLLLIVIGFTACVLFLAHIVGVMFRAQRAGEPWVQPVLTWIAVTVWCLLGLAGLYLRLTWHQAATADNTIAIVGQAPSTAATASAAATPAGSPAGTDVHYPVFGAAMIFFGLYLGTGVVATVGGYLTHNPALAAFNRARRRYIRLVDDTADAARGYAEARGQLELVEARQANGDRIEAADRIELMHVGEELKQRARALIAQRAQDAALTDAYFPEDDG
jgi:hypothetical protein